MRIIFPFYFRYAGYLFSIAGILILALMRGFSLIPDGLLAPFIKFILIGGLGMVLFSAEKKEDEYFQQLRLQAISIAIGISILFHLIHLILQFGAWFIFTEKETGFLFENGSSVLAGLLLLYVAGYEGYKLIAHRNEEQG